MLEGDDGCVLEDLFFVLGCLELVVYFEEDVGCESDAGDEYYSFVAVHSFNQGDF